MTRKIESLLTGIGFNNLEASVYLALLREPGVTGYRVSRLIGKPVANTYKALDALRKKAAVVVDGSARSRVYVAVPVSEYLEGQKQNLEVRRQELEAELKDLGASQMEEGIYKLGSAEQVYARIRSMLESAKSVVLLDAWPGPLEELQADLRKAARRGVRVMVKTYAPAKVAGCEVMAPQKPAVQLKVWKGDWLNVVVDGQEYVLSLLQKEGSGVLEAVWSRNPYLALQTHFWFLQEFTLTSIARMLWKGSTSAEVFKEAERINRTYLHESTVMEASAPWANLQVIKEWERKQMKDKKSVSARKKKA